MGWEMEGIHVILALLLCTLCIVSVLYHIMLVMPVWLMVSPVFLH